MEMLLINLNYMLRTTRQMGANPYEVPAEWVR